MTAISAPNDGLLLLIPCRAFTPISWSGQDTAATLRQVKAHNAAWLRLCRREN